MAFRDFIINEFAKKNNLEIRYDGESSEFVKRNQHLCTVVKQIFSSQNQNSLELGHSENVDEDLERTFVSNQCCLCKSVETVRWRKLMNSFVLCNSCWQKERRGTIKISDIGEIIESTEDFVEKTPIEVLENLDGHEKRVLEDDLVAPDQEIDQNGVASVLKSISRRASRFRENVEISYDDGFDSQRHSRSEVNMEDFDDFEHDHTETSLNFIEHHISLKRKDASDFKLDQEVNDQDTLNKIEGLSTRKKRKSSTPSQSPTVTVQTIGKELKTKNMIISSNPSVLPKLEGISLSQSVEKSPSQDLVKVQVTTSVKVIKRETGKKPMFTTHKEVNGSPTVGLSQEIRSGHSLSQEQTGK